MMFWGRGSNSSTTFNTEHTTLSRQSAQNEHIPVNSTIPVAPSYVLSDQRRNELLTAARTNRMTWVDGVDQRTIDVKIPSTLSSLTIPSHCHDALKGINEEMTKLFTSLDDLKHKILPNDLQLSEDAQSDSNTQSYKRYRTLFQELREHETLLDQWQRSHSPRTKLLTGHDREMAFLAGFRELVTVLKSAQAAELVYRIQSFVKRAELWDLQSMLRAVSTRDRPGGKVQDFIKNLIEQIKHSQKLRVLIQGDDEKLKKHGTFLHVRDSNGEDLLHEVLEAFLMEKLYTKTLSPSKEVVEQDKAFHERVSLLGFVTYKHLDLPVPTTEEHELTWSRLAKQLEAMTLCPSPRRKIDGVLQICQDLTTFLKAQNGGRFPSADEFLPAMIYVVLRANPCELKRNVAFILEYRNPAKLVSEPGYFFTHLVSSVAFLEEVDGSCLTISSDEFDEELRRSKESVRLRKFCQKIKDEESIESGSKSDTSNASIKESQVLSHPSNHTGEGDEFRLPTVLEIRARRMNL
ncbi:Vacuolar assembly/sorting protein VPS9 [Plasmopara halstedii]|uniref:Vacuolar assembly/sorting protein VPS9 n=1 Tax=Plasmopara halstedii TaxID=4781 RepID=A0A0P1AU95_PLAHL|nr:Vacuolar assembly/sorting protein VPS9 [Plasmopara halstedii]CEG44441.1 Vacuolar assembly/sorting protein VPS9 [Plasmopara halstedii]|eukprot:XP_024580810.1 Vacuolar assembly/sorting protein VPS9 [Plasmopara halstedii]